MVKLTPKIIIFDLDGVLVDVREPHLDGRPAASAVYLGALESVGELEKWLA